MRLAQSVLKSQERNLGYGEFCVPRCLTRLYFGPAGVPHAAKRRSTIEGVRTVRELGLDAMEIEFVRGVRMSETMAQKVREEAQNLGIVLTVHAPYYINLNSDDPNKVEASKERIYQSAKIGFIAGAWSVVFHPGYYGKRSSEETYRRIRDAVRDVVERLKSEGIDIWLRPETMGGLAEFGSLEEVVKLSQDLDLSILPCIDFAHIHARSRGGYNSYEELRQLMEYIERELGKDALHSMHIHVSGIRYGDRGEIEHLNLEESDLNYKAVIKVLKEFNVAGVVISESPNLEEDAILLKKLYEET